jgi:hypothetical protein
MLCRLLAELRSSTAQPMSSGHLQLDQLASQHRRRTAAASQSIAQPTAPTVDHCNVLETEPSVLVDTLPKRARMHTMETRSMVGHGVAGGMLSVFLT